ncbi:glycan-binding surface protein [Lutibacter aestuarii]|uniref:Glycan-binding surface protein n=1 Tax=Lutibacter aestuarii TaxID=861111 RepID=A0ABW2Z8C8_9FLAO
MKNYVKKYLFLFLIAIFIISCSDVVTYNDNWDDELTSYGPPSITDITIPFDNTSVSTAEFDDMINVIGDNLTDVKSITINDIELDLTTIYATRHKITLAIPREIPQQVTNKVTVITKLGEASHPISVTIPEIKIEGLYNEFALPGETVQIIGSNFDLYNLNEEETVISYNGEDVVATNFTSNTIDIVIPTNAISNSKFVLSSPKVVNPIDISYRNEGYILFNFDNYSDKYVTDGSNEGDPVALNGSFIRMAGSFSAWSYNNLFAKNYSITDQDILDNPQDYYFIFEAYTSSSQPISIDDQIKFNNNTWDPYGNSTPLNTYDTWRTMKTEVVDMFPDSGTYALGKRFFLLCQPKSARSFDFSMANFRFVKK